MNDDPSASIINFTRNVWRTCFQKYNVAPKTLCYDPLSTITGTQYGLCHLAHDGIYMSNFDIGYNPDDQIYSIDPYDKTTYPANSNDLTTSDIQKLPILECILFVSCDNLENIQQVLEKLDSKGVVIVINECVKLSKEFIKLDIKKEPMHGETISKGGDTSRHREAVKDISAFMKS